MGTLIDRIEELLAEMAEEDEDEEREDVSAQGRGAVVSGGLRPEGRTVFAQSEGLGRAAGEIAAEEVEETAETAWKPWRDGPVWTVQSVVSEMDKVRRTAAAERTVQTGEVSRQARDGNLVWAGLERAARGGPVGLTLESAGRAGAEQAGLDGLYRQTVRGLRPAAPALPPGLAEGTARAQEPGSAAALAVDELDRAVRRDSRRYDGGLSIY